MCVCVCLSVCLCLQLFQIAHLSPILLDHTSAYDILNFPHFPVLPEEKKGRGECACARARVYSRISNRPYFPDFTVHDWFSRIASCPHSSWTLSALASTLSCPFLPSKLGHKCACAALEVARSSQFVLCHTFLCMHAK